MSLINDALRRAKHSQQSRAHAVAGELPLQPVEPLPTAAGVPWTLFAAVSVAALIFAAGLVWQLRHHHARPAAAGERTATASLPPPPVAAASAAPSAPVTSAPSVAPTASAPTPAVVPAQLPEAETVESAPPAAPVSVPPTEALGEAQPADLPADASGAAPPAPAFPALKLQGIFYSRTKPSALINGRTLFLGDQVEGAVVKRIDALQVEVEFHGQSRTLSLR